jgi:hypothetical protein
MISPPTELAARSQVGATGRNSAANSRLAGNRSGLNTRDKATFNEKLFAFLLGLGTRLQVQVIGYLPFTEIFLLLAFPFYLPRIQSSGAMRRTAWCLPLLFVWLVGLVASDLYRHTEWSLAARGVARIVIYVIAIPFFTWFLRTNCYDKVLWWTIGSLPSAVLSAYVFRGGVHEGREMVYGAAEIKYETHWGAVISTAVAIFCLLTYQRRRTLCYLAKIVQGVAHIINGVRSGGALAILAVAVTATLNWVRGGRTSSFQLRRISFAKLIVIGAVALASIFGVATWYSESARRGKFGEQARVKYESQARNRYGLLAGGRPDFVGGLLAFGESPLLGYGSWPLDNTRVFARACDMMGVQLSPSYYSKGYPLIPSHSHILGACVEAGVLGMFFFLYIFVLLGRAIYLPILDENRLRFWIVTSALSLLWGILFSPISNRLGTAFLLGAIFNQVIWSQRDPWSLGSDASQRP